MTRSTLNDPDSSIRSAEDRKMKKYEELAAANDLTFTPLALECYGALSTSLQKLVTQLCRARAEALEIDEEVVLNY